MKGTGLGLFIVKAITQKHGGKVFAESDGEGQGTTIAFRVAEVGRMSRVLVVEDEAHLAQGLRFNLEAEGYAAEVVGDGEAATDRLLEKKESFDVVVLDIMLPGKDGFSVVSELRAARNYVPVLMLTARGRPEDVLKGFASGADDYLPKPFDLSILLARLQGLLRRSQWMHGVAVPPPSEAAPSPVEPKLLASFPSKERPLTSERLELRSGGHTVHLTLMESELLRHLVRNDGHIVSRKQILEEVWGLHEDTDTRAIDNFVVRLRRYIENDPANPQQSAHRPREWDTSSWRSRRKNRKRNRLTCLGTAVPCCPTQGRKVSRGPCPAANSRVVPRNMFYARHNSPTSVSRRRKAMSSIRRRARI